MSTITLRSSSATEVANFRDLVLSDQSQFVEPVIRYKIGTYKVYGKNFDMLSKSSFITGINSEDTIIDLSGRLYISQDSNIQYRTQISISTEGSFIINGELIMLGDIKDFNDKNQFSVILHSNKEMSISDKVKIF